MWIRRSVVTEQVGRLKRRIPRVLGYFALSAASADAVKLVEEMFAIADCGFGVLIDGNGDRPHVQHSLQPVTLRTERVNLVEHSLQQRFRRRRRNAGLLQLQYFSALPADLNAPTRDL